jgi:hypothetical protein
MKYANFPDGRWNMVYILKGTIYSTLKNYFVTALAAPRRTGRIGKQFHKHLRNVFYNISGTME